jgi:hypothetical protein
MSNSKLTDTLDSISDKAFGFNENSSESNSTDHEASPRTNYEENTETLDTPATATAEYPTAEHPTEQFAPESDPEDRQGQSVCEKPFIRDQKPFAKNSAPSFPVGGEHAVSPEPYPHLPTNPQPPANPPSQHRFVQGRKESTLRTGPEQDFTVSTVAGFMGVLSLLLMFNSPVVGLLAIIFGVTAVYYGRKTERAGIGASIGKTLGWFSFFGGIVAFFAAAFFLFVAFVYTMIR